NTRDQLDAAYRYFEKYQCREVLHNLAFLRRNRIARDYNLKKQFGVFRVALKIDAKVVMFNQQQLRRGTDVIMRKLIERLWQHTQQSKARNVHRRLKHIIPVIGARRSEQV